MSVCRSPGGILRNAFRGVHGYTAYLRRRGFHGYLFLLMRNSRLEGGTVCCCSVCVCFSEACVASWCFFVCLTPVHRGRQCPVAVCASASAKQVSQLVDFVALISCIVQVGKYGPHVGLCAVAVRVRGTRPWAGKVCFFSQSVIFCPDPRAFLGNFFSQVVFSFFFPPGYFFPLCSASWAVYTVRVRRTDVDLNRETVQLAAQCSPR